MRYLVTGGAGFLGSALVKRLVGDGSEVVVLDDMSRGNARRLRGVNCHLIEGDIRDPDAVLAAMQGCESVVHMAYLQGTQTFYAEPRQVLDVAIRGMLNILTACEQTGCADLLLVSSSEAYQVAPFVPTPENIPLVVPDVLNPRYSYGGGKIACEIMSLAWARTGVLDRLIITRPHNIYGPDAGYEHVIPELGVRVRKVLDESPDYTVHLPIQGTGKETRAFCHIDDCVDAFALLLKKAERPIAVYNVGNPEEVTIEQLVERIGLHYNRNVKAVPGVLPKGSPPRRCPDISRLRALGYEPKIPLTVGLPAVLDWYGEHPK